METAERRAVERVKAMLELMSQEALRLGVERRREVALATMRDAHTAEGVRRATGTAIVALGQRVAGELASSNRTLRPTSDCP